MSQKINTTSIGLFIVSGLALGVTGLLLFSSSKLFTHTRDVIAYFDESLNGLNEGAPVKYRGVTIGSVKRVMVRFNQATNDYAMPVILELQEELLSKRMGEANEIFTDHSLDERIKLGLRASLQTESLVTGVLYVDIRPNPGAPPPVRCRVPGGTARTVSACLVGHVQPPAGRGCSSRSNRAGLPATAASCGGSCGLCVSSGAECSD